MRQVHERQGRPLVVEQARALSAIQRLETMSAFGPQKLKQRKLTEPALQVRAELGGSA